MGVWQEQVIKLIEDGAGMTAAEADEVRRPFASPNNEHLIACTGGGFWMARGGTLSRRRPPGHFSKINGYYAFPESHSQAFAATAYQAAWLKRDDQPMGFYSIEALKQDEQRFGKHRS